MQTKEQRREYIHRYAEEHPDYYTAHNKICSEKVRKEIFRLLGDKCIRCGFLDPRAFQIDHIHGNGRKDREGKSQYTYYRIILEKIKAGNKDYQLLCANCNQIKKIENREFGHDGST